MLQNQPTEPNSFSTVPLVLGAPVEGSANPASSESAFTRFLSALSEQWIPDQITDWQRDSDDPSRLVFIARHLPSGNRAILRLLPWLVTDAQKTRCREHLRLIEWLGTSHGAEHLEDRLDDSPPSLLACYADLPELVIWLPQKDVQQRLRLADDLIDAISKAHSVGLVHGNLSADCIHIDPRGGCCVDFLAVFDNPNFDLQTASFEDDLRILNALVQRVLTEGTDDHDWLNRLGGQRRARLNQLLKSLPDASEVHETISRWRDLIFELCPNDEETGKSISCKAESRSGQPDALDSRSRENYHSKQTRESELAVDDQTCEVDIVHVQVGCNIGNSTDNIGVSEAVGNSPSFCALPQAGQMLGRFQLVKQIGQGGMGVVFEGRDIATLQKVAVKILRVTQGDREHAIRRFRKEARLLHSIRNDFVTQLVETGVDGGHYYLVMEYVAGTNLRDWLNAREALDEPTALRLVADIARALVDAHRQDIVHRDIKPENVLLARLAEGNVATENLEMSQLRVKLSDFGIARQMRQTESMEVTRPGAMIGTPIYMSPEQCMSTGEIGPSSDVYSLGILLYRLLTGTLPFESDDPMKLVAMHCFDSPPSLQKRNRAISDATSELVSRMLAKDPLHRPADAGQLVAEIERLLRGEPSQFEAHPHVPVVSENRVWTRVFEWNLSSSSAELWPFVSNTERLNRAVGLSSVSYRTERDPRLGLRRFGSFKLAGRTIEWEEHPFEWIEGSRMGVLREFGSGPFLWFSSVVELVSQPCGGTRLIHTVRIEPRNLMGRVIAEIEAGWKGGRSLDRVYRRIDNWLQQAHTKSLGDPYETCKTLSHESERRLTRRLEAAVAQGVSFELAAKLGDYLRRSPPQVLAQIRPLALAEILGETSESVLDACLIAAHNNLMQLRWDILCPTCRAPASTVSWLSEINQHTGCEACDTEFQSNLANAIELVFQVHPEIRQADSGQYCIGGPEHSPHVVIQLRLAPEERIEVVVPLTTGDYILRGPRLAQSLSLRARARATPSQLEVKLSQIGTSNCTPIVRSGQVAFHLTNDFDTTQVVRIERTIQRSNVVTAAAASALPRFRELFPDQVFRSDLPVATADLTFLAVRVVRSEEIYTRCSDADGYLLMHTALNAIERGVLAHQGAVIKSVGESLLASFQGCSDAVKAAFALSARLREIPELEEIEVRCGIHRGSVLITTQNGRIDYFGTTVRTVEALVSDEQAAVVLTDAVFADPEVSRWLARQRHDPSRHNEQIERLSLPAGIRRLLQVFPLTRPLQIANHENNS